MPQEHSPVASGTGGEGAAADSIDLTRTEELTPEQHIAALQTQLQTAITERDEYRNRLEAMSNLVGQLGHRLTQAALNIEEKERVERVLRELATTDYLTGLPNRAAFEDELERRELNDNNFAIAVVDLTNFKAVNDRYGHKVGDEVIKSSGDLIVQAILAHKTRENDFVAHISGDEFAIIFDMDPREDTELLPEERLDRIRENLLANIRSYGQLAALDQFGFSASVGIAIHDPLRTVEETYQEADRQMFEHKHRQHEELGRYRS